ncbi:MAG TPA: VOC family protein, partial [Kofleriaceae bacterium]|nr:VOC family protein [Kofleriaceae bacterium]
MSRSALDALDHLILAAASLDEGVAFVRERFGVSPKLGMRNPAAGTDHARVALGPRRYLEILAPAPGNELSPTLEPIRRLAAPSLYSWAIATDAGPGPRADWLGDARSDVPGGSFVRWRNLAVTIALGAAAPAFIHWSDGAPHPADDAPPAGRVIALRLAHPDPAAAAAALAKAGFTAELARADAPSFSVEIETRAGATITL